MRVATRIGLAVTSCKLGQILIILYRRKITTRWRRWYKVTATPHQFDLTADVALDGVSLRGLVPRYGAVAAPN